MGLTMPTLPRCCSTCEHLKGFDGVHGRCGHPARKPLTDVAVIVRGRELPCRIAWALDSWEERKTVRVTDLIVWGPITDDTPLDDFPDDLLGWLMNNEV
jgi:hypothetical protein